MSPEPPSPTRTNALRPLCPPTAAYRWSRASLAWRRLRAAPVHAQRPPLARLVWQGGETQKNTRRLLRAWWRPCPALVTCSCRHRHRNVRVFARVGLQHERHGRRAGEQGGKAARARHKNTSRPRATGAQWRSRAGTPARAPRGRERRRASPVPAGAGRPYAAPRTCCTPPPSLDKSQAPK